MKKNTIFLMILATSLTTSTAMAKEPSAKEIQAFWDWNACVNYQHFVWQLYFEPLKELRESFENYSEPVSPEECYSVVTLAQNWIESMRECLHQGQALLKLGCPAYKSVGRTNENLRNNIRTTVDFKRELRVICSRL